MPGKTQFRARFQAGGAGYLIESSNSVRAFTVDSARGRRTVNVSVAGSRQPTRW
jgi:hypothetical protein